jgi:hypothetical protein
MSFWWCGRRRNLLQGQGSHASSGVMMISKMGTSSIPPPSCGGRRHARDLFKNTQQDNLEGGGAVAVGEQPKKKLLKFRQFCAMKMQQNYERWVPVFDHDNVPVPEYVASVTSKNPDECISQFQNSVLF